MSVKTCSVCGRTMNVKMFYRWKYSKDGLRSQCKECCKVANKQYYDTHSEELVEYQRYYVTNNFDKVANYQHKYWEDNKASLKEYNRMSRSAKREFVNGLKTNCVKCGESRKYIIDFHHKNPSEKTFEISDIFRRSEEEVINEVKKCVCLCRNCHGEFHHLYGTKPKQPLEALDEYLSK